MPPNPHTPNSAAPVLEAEGLSCVRDDRVLFSNLDFRLGPGEALILEGHNGSGKTSLLHILSALRWPDGGSLRWSGRDVFELGHEYHEHMAYLGHRNGSKQDLTPLENLRFHRGLGAARTDISLYEALDQMGLYGFEDSVSGKLSAGQQRRAAIARLLVTDARLWILDEPFTSLDRRGIQLVENLMRRHLAKGGMLAMTTHHELGFGEEPIHRINLSE